MNTKYTLSVVSLLILSSGAASVSAQEGHPSLEPLFPIPEEVRQILDQRCVFCHGEVIDGEAEIREDLDLSTEAAIRETLYDLDTFIEMIEEDEMPQEAKLSYRLRRQPEMQARLKKLKEEYEEQGEKEKLLAWLREAAK